MRFLVDGHNLIPKVGLRLDSVDDEPELIEILAEFSRKSGATIEVFFDGAPAGHAASRRTGRVTARFISQASSADAAIRQRLKQLGGDARNWVVATSDREVLQSAKSAHAQTVTSEQLASMIRHQISQSNPHKSRAVSGQGEVAVSESEVQEWLEVFRQRKK